MSDASTQTPGAPENPMVTLQRFNEMLDRQVMDTALTAGTAGVAFASDIARQHALNLIRQDLRVEGDTAKARDGRPAAEFIRERLSSPDYDCFIASTHSGGGTARPGGGASAMPGPSPAVEMPEPRTMGERMIAHALANRNAPAGDPRYDMGRSFGIGRVR